MLVTMRWLVLVLAAGCASYGGATDDMNVDLATGFDQAEPDQAMRCALWVGNVCYTQGDQDMAMTSPSPSPSSSPDMVSSAVIDMATSSSSGDMTQPSLDMVPLVDMQQLCNSAVPTCSSTILPNGTHCCNGAQCINGNCWNPPGGYCCTGSGCNPVVACWQSPGTASGVCGVDHKCQ